MTAKFPVLPANSSRQEEINYLRDLADSLPLGSFLKMLLNPRLVDWFDERATIDGSTDLMEDVQGLENTIDQQRAEAEAQHQARTDQTRGLKEALVAALADCQRRAEAAGIAQEKEEQTIAMLEQERKSNNQVEEAYQAKIAALEDDLVAADERMAKMEEWILRKVLED